METMISSPAPGRTARKTQSLSQAGIQVIDCDHRTPQAAATGLPYVTIPQMQQGRLDLDSSRRISPEDFVEWTRKAKPSRYDVVLSRRCNPGETAFVGSDAEFALGQNLVLLRTDDSQVFPPFLRWIVQSPEWWAQVKKYLNHGAVFDSLKIADIKNFELTFPSLPEQRDIARILGALDDKIELNRRMSQTLEEIARTLFKSWFVDFDPVHAKAAGRQPAGMDAETAALFPSEFEESELGLIPEGWRVSTIGEEVKVVGGSTPSTSVSEFWDGGTNAWATPKDLATLQIPLLTSTERQITDVGVQQISSRQLPPGTLLMSSRAPVGYLAISQIPVSINQGFIAMICEGIISPAHALWWAQANLGEIRGRANGTTFQEISKSNFRPIPIVVPAPEVANRFSDQTAPLIERMALLIEESLTLKNLRDTLLPRLLSGELHLS